MSLLIGCDPEVFITHSGLGIVSGIDLIGGSKAAPRPVQDGTLQEDNVLAEIGITPASTEDEWVIRITSVLNQLTTHLKGVDAGLDFVVQSSNIMDDRWLQHPMALQFGCDPDFNAYTGKQNASPSSATNLRTAGGHIHFGYPVKDGAVREDVIRAADLLIGIPAVLVDGDKERMKLYGKAGAYRTKKYGVEYRTPSNFWLKSEALMRWVYRQSVKAYEYASNNDVMGDIKANEDYIVDAINNADVSAATHLINYFNIELPQGA